MELAPEIYPEGCQNSQFGPNLIFIFYTTINYLSISLRQLSNCAFSLISPSSYTRLLASVDRAPGNCTFFQDVGTRTLEMNSSEF